MQLRRCVVTEWICCLIFQRWTLPRHACPIVDISHGLFHSRLKTHLFSKSKSFLPFFQSFIKKRLFSSLRRSGYFPGRKCRYDLYPSREVPVCHTVSYRPASSTDHSTETAIAAVIGDMPQAVDDNLIRALVLLDLSAAYSTLWIIRPCSIFFINDLRYPTVHLTGSVHISPAASRMSALFLMIQVQVQMKWNEMKVRWFKVRSKTD